MIRTVVVIGILGVVGIAGLERARESFQTTQKAPQAILQAAAAAMEASHRTTGTYVGTSPDSVAVVFAAADSYCIDYGGYFLAGPGGTPTPGRCPR